MPPRTYHFKHYRRTAKGKMCGELLRDTEIVAKGMAYAVQIAERDHMPGVDFDHDFAILEGDEFLVCYFAKDQYA